MRERLAESRRKYEELFQKQLEEESSSLESEMMANLEDKLSKRGYLSKKEIKEMLKALESELKVKLEAILMEARQSTLERSNGN